MRPVLLSRFYASSVTVCGGGYGADAAGLPSRCHPQCWASCAHSPPGAGLRVYVYMCVYMTPIYHMHIHIYPHIPVTVTVIFGPQQLGFEVQFSPVLTAPFPFSVGVGPAIWSFYPSNYPG